MSTPVIRPLPADAYSDGLFAAYLDKKTFLNIHAIHGVHGSWIFATLLDADTEELIDERCCRLEHDRPNEPIFLFVHGKPLMFDPIANEAHFAEWGEHSERNIAVRVTDAVSG